MPLWEHCSQALVTAIDTGDLKEIARIRDRFDDDAYAMTHRWSDEDVTVALAWAIIVESALLTEQIALDMKESAAAKGCPNPHEGWFPYFLPNPPLGGPAGVQRIRGLPLADSRLRSRSDHAAAEHLRHLQRPPRDATGHVARFRLGQDQRQQLDAVRPPHRVRFRDHRPQQHHRRLLARLGHFWLALLPRFQTPDIESNGKVFFRDLLIGGPNKNALLRQRRLEPGIRECVAVVIMPSFVPYADLNVTSGWFCLTNPKHKLMDSAYAMRMSKTVRSIEKCRTGHQGRGLLP